MKGGQEVQNKNSKIFKMSENRRRKIQSISKLKEKNPEREVVSKKSESRKIDKEILNVLKLLTRKKSKISQNYKKMRRLGNSKKKNQKVEKLLEKFKKYRNLYKYNSKISKIAEKNVEKLAEKNLKMAKKNKIKKNRNKSENFKNFPNCRKIAGKNSEYLKILILFQSQSKNSKTISSLKN